MESQKGVWRVTLYKITKRPITATTPSKLLNALLLEFNLKTDRQLSIWLGYSSPSCICWIRHSQVDVGANLILRIYDFTGWSIEKIRNLAGIEKIDYEESFK